MFSGLLIILIPLIVGYLIPLRHRAALKLINRLLSWIVYLILFFMGISLAFLDNLASNLLSILHYSAVSVTVILLCNIAALLWLERSLPGGTTIGRKNCHHALPWRWSRYNFVALLCWGFCWDSPGSHSYSTPPKPANIR